MSLLLDLDFNYSLHSRVWLKTSSEEMHKHYERRRDNPPPFPSTPDEQAMYIFENGVQAMVLEERPVQEPVVWVLKFSLTEIKLNVQFYTARFTE